MNDVDEDDVIGPADSVSNIELSSDIGGSECAAKSAASRRGLGKKAAKLVNETKHFENSVAASQRVMAEASKAKNEFIARQTLVLEKELALKEDQADIALITAKTDGLSEIAKQLLEMKQRVLLQKIQQQMNEN